MARSIRKNQRAGAVGGYGGRRPAAGHLGSVDGDHGRGPGRRVGGPGYWYEPMRAAGWGSAVRHSETEVRQPVGRPRRASGLVSELVVSKLRPPPMRPGTVVRTPLVERLARGDPRPVVSVAAPAGYGKTTLLSQWAERDGAGVHVGVGR
jgi:hypothetical protein